MPELEKAAECNEGDMMNKYPCDVLKLILACICVPIFTGLVWGCVFNAVYIGAAVFAALDALYAYHAVKCIGMIHVDDDLVTYRILGKTVLSLRWDELREVGLINKKYIYFSKDEMDNDSRFEMCFHWPPKDKIYFRASRRAQSSVELLWSRKSGHFIEYKPEKIRVF